MSRALITESYLTGIANAIRTKLGVQDTYTPPQMAAAISSIVPKLQEKTTTQNGVVLPDSGYDGLSKVNVNVSGGGGGVNLLHGDDYPDTSIGSDGDIYLWTNPAGVKNTAGQYIDTGYSGNGNSKYVIDFCLAETQTANWPTLFGVRDAAGNVTNASYYSASISERNYSGANIAWGNAATNIQGIGASAMIGKRCQIVMQSDSVDVSINGVTTSHALTTGALSVTQAHMGLFAMIAAGQAQSFSYTNGMILYAFKIYENDTLVHSYAAARDTNDVPCIYDGITQEYIYHSGGGALTFIDSGEIVMVFVKSAGAWINIIGADISEVIT